MGDFVENVRQGDGAGRAALPRGRGRAEARPSDMPLPTRKRPSKNSVRVFSADLRPVILYVTVCAYNRQPIFANERARAIFLRAFSEADHWMVGRYVIMPDHIHFFCAPRLGMAKDFHRWIKYWKSCVTRLWHKDAQGGPHFCAAADAQERVPPGMSADEQKRVPPVFQRECWDVQIRNAADFAEKMNYVLGNPVRKGFVANWSEWPYQGEIARLEWHG